LVVEKVAQALNDERKPVKDSRILVLGVAYKRDIDDMRESPALDVIRLLEEWGAQVVYHDPHIPWFRDDGYERTGVELSDSELSQTDAVVIITDHSGIDYQRVVDLAPVVVDTRNATAGMVRKGARLTDKAAPNMATV